MANQPYMCWLQPWRYRQSVLSSQSLDDSYDISYSTEKWIIIHKKSLKAILLSPPMMSDFS